MAHPNRYSDSFNMSFNQAVPSPSQHVQYQETAFPQHRRRSNRVSKPSSAGNSPHNAQMMNRRRTTAAQWYSSRHTSLLSQGLENASNRQSLRPTSWHPSSQQSLEPPAMTMYGTGHMSAGFGEGAMHATTAVNGLITPLTYPHPDEPFNHGDTFPFLDESLNYQGQIRSDVYYGYSNGATTAPYHPNSRNLQDNVYCSTPGSFDYVTSPATRHQTTAPPTPDFLPIQNFTKSPSPEYSRPDSSGMDQDQNSGSLFLQTSTIKGNELIGVGLYDLPSPTERPKCLQLEQTFVPEESSEEADANEDTSEEEEEGVDEDEDDDDDEQPDHESKDLVPANVTTAASTARPANLLNHTFFFENEQDAHLLSQQDAYLQPQFDLSHLSYPQNYPPWPLPNTTPTPCGWV